MRTLAIILAAAVGTLVAPASANAAETRSYYGLTSSQYQSVFDNLAPQGFRPSYMRGYESSGEARYNLTMVRQGGNRWVARHGLDSSDFKAVNDSMKLAGYRLELHSAYRVGGTWYHTAMWALK